MKIYSKFNLHEAFQVSLILKGLDGLLELIGGAVLLLISPAALSGLAKTLTEHELSQDPNDFVSRHILHSAALLTHSSTIFGGLYLLSHGLVKIILIIAVLHEKLWAFPWIIGFISLFMLYQIYRIGYHPSFGLVFLTIFDGLVIWLTYQEWQSRKLLKPQVAGGALH